jgi:glycosyltransferase involved in cell wall biosynthesis
VDDAARPPESSEGELLELTIVVPSLNEARSLAGVVETGLRAIGRLGLRGEVLVSDNGSSDGSPEVARRSGARVTSAAVRGYGSALRQGMSEARGRLIVIADADASYDLEEIDAFVAELRAGADLVMGTRLPPGRVLPGANPWLNRHLGTPALTFVVNRLFGTRIRDINCGMRGLTREAYRRLDLRAEGMELASELVIKAALHGFSIREVPVTLHPDRRGRRPHLRRWRDGWRHLEFMLLHAPDQLLFAPGLAALFLGLALALPVAFGPRVLFGRLFDFHYLFYGGALVLVGAHCLMGAILVRDGVGGLVVRRNRLASLLSDWLTFGRSLLLGGVLVAAGLALEVAVLAIWLRGHFGPLLEPRRSVLGMLLVAAGAEVVVFGFLHGVFRKHRPPSGAAPVSGVRSQRSTP